MASTVKEQQKSGSGEATKSREEVAFTELKNKIVGQALKIEPGSAYLILVKKGALTKIERDVFLSLWGRNLKTGALIFEVDDPEKDVRALEITR